MTRHSSYAKWYCLDCVPLWTANSTPCPHCCGYTTTGPDADEGDAL